MFYYKFAMYFLNKLLMKSFISGHYVNEGYYNSFHPNKINREWKFEDTNLMVLLSKADRMLGRLDMYSNHIPNIDLFIEMHILKEATQSTRIEGTQTNMEEALMPEEYVPLNKRDDWTEVQNYIQAMNEAIDLLQTLPLSARLLKHVHKILMKGVRGEHKQPGEFRTSQNWIGGNNISDAIFVPPIHTEIAELISDIEMFIHQPKVQLPDLIKIAIIHYQFETIHPFNDGNGRVGRLLITLYLVSIGLLKRPVLYLSDYLENHRNAYYASIMDVRDNNNIEGWISFFLTGIIETAEKSVETFDNILRLEKHYEQTVQQMGLRSANAMKLITEMYKHPIIDASRISSALNITLTSAYNLISAMMGNGILYEITKGKRGKKYILKDYFELFLS